MWYKRSSWWRRRSRFLIRACQTGVLTAGGIPHRCGDEVFLIDPT
jgi:hypothetical protein